MGVKRPLEEEDLPELSFKQPKQVDDNKNLTFSTEDFPCHTTSLRVDSPAKSNFSELHFDGMLGNGDKDGSSADKELEGSGPLSLVTSISSEEDAGNGGTSSLSNNPACIDLSIPRRPPQQFEDPYEYLLNCSPRKEIPIGPDHQAEVPQWDVNASGKYFAGLNNFIDDNMEQKLMGTRIIPMPDLNDSSIDGVRVGRGRTDCSCLDVGSMRCVQQHVKETREKLRETIGDENFMKLGFHDMGEEVARKWTGDDEQLFHEVIFSNPVSHGRDFWKRLSSVFPTRTKKEIVSYYFNVFMLWRRAVQNRSYLLQIDSDDDEDREGDHGNYCQNRSSLLDLITDDDDGEDDLNCTHGEFYLVGGEDEDSTVESLGDQDFDAGWVDEFGSEPENICGDEDGDPNHGTSDGDSRKQDAVEMDGGRDQISGKDTKKFHDD